MSASEYPRSHSSLANLGADAHPQYLNQTRGDARYPLLTTIDAAGDLLVGSADNTVTRLALGTAGQVLQVNAAGSGLAYAASFSQLSRVSLRTSGNTTTTTLARVNTDWLCPSFIVPASGSVLVHLRGHVSANNSTGPFYWLVRPVGSGATTTELQVYMQTNDSTPRGPMVSGINDRLTTLTGLTAGATIQLEWCQRQGTNYNMTTSGSATETAIMEVWPA